ncbi:MAG: imidazole glycerol phosphate synthase subunit HisH [Candidatus Marinimicrobia bacterium]|nr:imidazole glycerol phosphate synthase subunit HisH [Candidatus Neomarinimicrobiota bacterium]
MNLKNKVGIIEYGAGNLASICNAIDFLNFDVKLISNPNDIKNYSHLVLPGVGHFGKLSKNLNRRGWPEKLEDFVKRGNYIFGICIGMQLLFQKSEEDENAKGLGFVKGNVKKFDKKLKLPIPHMGFNEVNFHETKIWKNIKNNSPFYFVHSYRIADTDDISIKSKTSYGEEFVSFIEKENIYGSQFHPEKSHKNGLKLLKNFIEL